MKNNIRSRNSAIVLCINDRFVPPTQAMIESIRVNGGNLDGVSLVIISEGLNQESIESLERSASQADLPLHIKLVSDTSELGNVASWAISACLRLYVGEMCEEFDRALFLDADMVVLKDLSPVLDIDLDGKSAASVINFPPLDSLRVAVPRSRRGDVDGDAAYFNAGVILFDIKRWKEKRIGERSRAFLNRFPTTRIFDQDALNIALANDWVQLDMGWNAPAGPLDTAPMLKGLARMNPSIDQKLKAWEQAQKDPYILHFTGQPKPWENAYPWPEFSEIFHQYVLPEFGDSWPSSKTESVSDPESGQEKTREFRRN